jgi:hypothetical protein
LYLENFVDLRKYNMAMSPDLTEIAHVCNVCASEALSYIENNKFLCPASTACAKCPNVGTDSCLEKLKKSGALNCFCDDNRFRRETFWKMLRTGAVPQRCLWQEVPMLGVLLLTQHKKVVFTHDVEKFAPGTEVCIKTTSGAQHSTEH